MALAYDIEKVHFIVWRLVNLVLVNSLSICSVLTDVVLASLIKWPEFSIPSIDHTKFWSDTLVGHEYNSDRGSQLNQSAYDEAE